MKSIYALVDYKRQFGSKWFAKPYRGGMGLLELKKEFEKYGYDLQYLEFSDVRVSDLRGETVIYTSQEDEGSLYKGYIEDMVYALEIAGAKVIPPYMFLRAHNNKVFMELLREELIPISYRCATRTFGCIEECSDRIDSFTYPCVVKSAHGSKSHGVFLASNKEDLISICKKITRSRQITSEQHDFIRKLRHPDYVGESRHRKKFIIQDFYPNLSNDWKIIVYFDKFYILRRENRPGDFRASGSGLFSYDENVDGALLYAAKEIMSACNVPMISLDLGISGNKVVLLEVQFVAFGTSTLEKAPYYYTYSDYSWRKTESRSEIEQEYARSIVKYLESF